jgi:hypothetical protein
MTLTLALVSEAALRVFKQTEVVDATLVSEAALRVFMKTEVVDTAFVSEVALRVFKKTEVVDALRLDKRSGILRNTVPTRLLHGIRAYLTGIWHLVCRGCVDIVSEKHQGRWTGPIAIVTSCTNCLLEVRGVLLRPNQGE